MRTLVLVFVVGSVVCGGGPLPYGRGSEDAVGGGVKEAIGGGGGEWQAATEPRPSGSGPPPTDEPQKNEKKPAEENLTGSIEVGYRIVGAVPGSLNTYRTLVNLGQGPRLLHTDFRYLNPSHKWFDSISGFASGWGDPYNMARLNIYKEAAYQLDFDYRNLLYYSSLPSFANPLQSFSQRTYDVNRRSFDLDFKIRPKAHISPYVALNRAWGRGTGITDFVNNSANEYAVFNVLNDRTDRYRAGARIEYSTFHVTVEEGGTTFKDDQNASTHDPNKGDRVGANNPYFLDTLNQAYRTRGSSVFTQVLGSWTPAEWIGLNGQFLYSRPKIDSTLSEVATGSFNVPGSLQYLTRYQDVLMSNASQPHSTGLYAMDLHPWKHFRILDSLLIDRFHTTGAAVLADLTPLPRPGAYADRLDYSYNRHQIEVQGDPLAWLTLRGGFRTVWGTATIRGSQVSGVASEQGQLGQQVLLLGAQARAFSKLWVNADFERGEASKAYFRTSLYDYTKAALRARYQMTTNWNVSWNSLWLVNQNPASGIALDFRHTQNGLSTLWTASKTISLLGDYYYSTLSSNISYLIPQQASPAISNYRDNAHTVSALVEINKYRGKLSFGGSMFRSSGSRPSAYYQPQARLQMPVRPHVALFGEWRYYGYGEPFYLYEQFHNHQFTAGLRLSR